MSINNRIFLTPIEVAELLMVSTASVRLWASKGLLPAQTTAGGHRRFLIHDIHAFAKEHGIAIEAKAKDALKILLVDDEPQLLCYLAELLDGQPGIAQVELAADGFEAGQKLEFFQPDVVLLDLSMPGLNGYEVCSRLKTNCRTESIRVVAMTGNPSQKNIEEVLAAGAEVCLTKPLVRSALFEALGLVV